MSTPTRRLYHDDAFLRQFTATVVAHGQWSGAASVVLDATAFYPEAGGQMADRGTLGGAALRDVQVDDAGVVHHLVDGALPEIGAAVAGEVDWARRRVHMAQHTGQHMLSRGLLDVARAATVSSRLGETACTIDLDRDGLGERAIADAEALVNAVIDDDVAIRAWFPAPDELAALPLRRDPKVDSDVRVIEIGAFDVSPCGGTHCARTAQVGQVRVVGVERHKGGTRVTFVAGRRAREVLAAHHDTLVALGQTFPCGPADVPAAVDSLRRALADTREALRAAQRRHAEALADRALAEPGARAVLAVPGGDAELLRVLAKRLTAAGRDAVLAAPGGDGTPILVARAAGSALDCGALVKALAAAAGGRGGGKPEHAEGRLPPSVDWPAVVAAAGAAP